MAFFSEDDFSSDDSSLEEIDFSEQQRNLREIERVRGLQTFGSTTNQYRRIHPEATQQEILQHRALLQNDKVSLDNIDLIHLETAHLGPATGEEFDPEYNFFRNRLVDEVRNLWEDVGIDKQILQDTFLRKQDLYYNASQKELRKSCESILAREGASLPKLDATRVYAQYLSTQMFLEQSRFTQWLTQQIVMIVDNLPEKIDEITGTQFSADTSPEAEELKARLDGTAELAKKLAFFSTAQDTLLKQIFDTSVPRRKVVEEVQKLERHFSLAKSRRSWKKEKSKRNRRSIVEVTKKLKPYQFQFADATKKKSSAFEQKASSKKYSRQARKLKRDQRSPVTVRPQRSRSYLKSRSRSKYKQRSASRGASRGRSNSKKRSLSRPRVVSPSRSRPRSNQVSVPNGQSVPNTNVSTSAET